MSTSYSALAFSYVVLGGEGFLGQHLVQKLRKTYPLARVASFGLTQRNGLGDSTYDFRRVDVTDVASIRAALKDVQATAVFHTVSPHHGAADAVCEAVNVKGTEAIVEACKTTESVRVLVFTSTMTVHLGGGAMRNIDERLPRVKDGDDFYASTKAIAEEIVLNANGQGDLATCALRLPGLLGPGDRQIVPNFIKVLKTRQHYFQLGLESQLFDWLHIDDAVRAHLLAASALAAGASIEPESIGGRLPPVPDCVQRRVLPTTKRQDVQTGKIPPPDPPLSIPRHRWNQFSDPSPADLQVAGSALLITAGSPLPFWDIAHRVYYEYDGSAPRFILKMPLAIGYLLAVLTEFFAWLLRTGEPGLTRARVKYVEEGMWCDIERARRLLKYEPEVNMEVAIKSGVDWYKEEERKAAKTKEDKKTR